MTELLKWCWSKEDIKSKQWVRKFVNVDLDSDDSDYEYRTNNPSNTVSLKV